MKWKIQQRWHKTFEQLGSCIRQEWTTFLSPKFSNWFELIFFLSFNICVILCIKCVWDFDSNHLFFKFTFYSFPNCGQNAHAKPTKCEIQNFRVTTTIIHIQSLAFNPSGPYTGLKHPNISRSKSPTLTFFSRTQLLLHVIALSKDYS